MCSKSSTSVGRGVLFSYTLMHLTFPSQQVYYVVFQTQLKSKASKPKYGLNDPLNRAALQIRP
jgi:hypothetical protein